MESSYSIKLHGFDDYPAQDYVRTAEQLLRDNCDIEYPGIRKPQRAYAEFMRAQLEALRPHVETWHKSTDPLPIDAEMIRRILR